MKAPARALPVINPARCTGCGWCVGMCAPHVLSLHASGGRKTSTLGDAAGCTGCALCAVRCPFGAIAMVRSRSAPASALQKS
ncbi:4Fe-4S dicluster domain-containing protein [Ottowia sp.]|uniref:ATP-binding protein n=1 Tax=Ottowia sp. TaxID=1898956 RepID=UPI002C9246F2|nr:4Fe-4S dicluster domain-containing protein [Ottowia sp.]HOB67254.1 4Fe-4S binding protein [Ottowia sp.]HPZ55755.1 4Fe-4S binding protein [Ottowia sp.]HQD46372.1 4Fe-4S binding protein [Ottowia sp.]